MRNHKIISILAILLIIALATAACAAAYPGAPFASSAVPAQSGAATTQPKEPTAESAKWINSTIVGSVTNDMQIQEKDDYYLAINHDWLANTKLEDGKNRMGVFSIRGDEIQKEIEAILRDDSLESHEAKLAQQLYNDYLDMDTRNELGIKPLLPYVEEILRIKSIEEMNSYLIKSEHDVLALPIIGPDSKDSSKYAVTINPCYFSLEDADEYRQITEKGERIKKALDVYNVKALMRIGYSEADAKAAWDKAFEFETKLAQNTMGKSASYKPDYIKKTYNPITIDEIKKASPVFPLAEIFEKKGYAESEIIVMTDTEWLDKLNKVYTEENLEGIKAYLILSLIRGYSDFLDEEFDEMNNEYISAVMGSKGTEPLEKRAYDTVNDHLGEVVGKLYIEQYFSDEIKTDVEEIIANAMKVYGKRLESNNWLGDETKNKALEKLGAIRVHVGYPEKWTDFSALKLKSADKGGNLFEDIEVISDFMAMLQLEKINTEVDKDKGEALAKPQVVNAFYNPSDNSINIPAGILGGIFYDKNGTDAARLGGIGVIIGHEITHAFDTMGSQYDKDGNVSNWWTDQDAAAFKERTDKVAEYFGSMEALPGMNVNGELVVTEATADLGGMSSMLELAKGMPDFDYDDFFETYVKIWMETQTKEQAEDRITGDEHPLNYLRANITVQQFDEFYDTKGIKEGDGMYLAPEKRLAVW